MGHVIHSPFRIRISEKKVFALNLNVYRNENYWNLNKAKKAYKELMREPISQLPRFDKITLKLVMYPKTRAKFDIGNVGSVVEKFFLDALTEFGKLEDDNYVFCPTVTYTFGEVDKNNPRVEIHIDAKV